MRKAVIGGLCVAILLGVMGFQITDREWWIGAITMNVMLNLWEG